MGFQKGGFEDKNTLDETERKKEKNPIESFNSVGHETFGAGLQ